MPTGGIVITYLDDVRPDAATIAQLYRSAGLRRPVDDLPRLQRFYDGSPVVWTAWDGETLVGILRGWTDGAYDGYVCDLAVAATHQTQGIGRELLERCCAPMPDVQWVLRASPVAARYYEHLGWQKIENGWFRPRR